MTQTQTIVVMIPTPAAPHPQGWLLPGRIVETIIPVAAMGDRKLAAHYFAGRFRCWYYHQFARGTDGALYRTAPAATPPYPEEVTPEVEWWLNDDVTFCEARDAVSDV